MITYKSLISPKLTQRCRFRTGNSEFQKRQIDFVCVFHGLNVLNKADNMIRFRQTVMDCLRCGFVRQVVTFTIKIRKRKSDEINETAS